MHGDVPAQVVATQFGSFLSERAHCYRIRTIVAECLVVKEYHVRILFFDSPDACGKRFM